MPDADPNSPSPMLVTTEWLAERLENPDFVQLARSFGIDAQRAKTPAQLQAALESALAGDRPALIEVAVDPDSEMSPWPLIHMAEAPRALEV